METIWYAYEYVQHEGWRVVEWSKSGSCWATRRVLYDRLVYDEMIDVMLEVPFERLRPTGR